MDSIIFIKIINNLGIAKIVNNISDKNNIQKVFIIFINSFNFVDK